MKRIAIAVIAAIVLAGILGSCQKKEPAAQSGAPAADPNAPVTITVWCWDPNFNIYAINEAAKVYNRTKPNVTVRVVETPWDDLQQKLITSFSSRQTDDLPDIILMQDNAIQKNIMTYPDSFLAVNGKVDVSQFAQFKLDVGNYNGRNYGIPFDNGATATFLRSDIVEQAGLKVSDFNDITWERFIELGKIVKQRTGVSMVSTDATGPDFIMVMLQSANTWLFDAQGKTYIKDNPVLKRAIELFGQGVQEGVILLASDWNGYISTLNNGTAASTIQGCWIIGSIVAEPSQAGKWAMVNTPKFGTIDSVNYSSQGGSGWMVLANSKNPDVAMDFLDKTFAGSVEFYETILPSSGAISTWLPAARSPVYSQPHPFFGGQKIYEELVSYAGKVPMVKYGVFNYEARTAVTRGFMDILQGRTTVDAALDAAQREVEFIISQ
jgi:lactose/L-arabinose transport system substrate-binding protein